LDDPAQAAARSAKLGQNFHIHFWPDMLPASRPAAKSGSPNPVFLLLLGFLWIAAQTVVCLVTCFTLPWLAVTCLDLALSSLTFAVSLSRSRSRDTMAMIAIGITGLFAFFTSMFAATPYHSKFGSA
jgi:hypothetical protein